MLKEDFFQTENEYSFYLAGFIGADGNIEKNHKGANRRLTIGLSEKDLLFLNNIKNLLGSDTKLINNISYGSRRNPLWKDTKSYTLRVSSSKIAFDLIKFNIVPNKTKIYTFPQWLINHPLVNHYMLGYNDGDGCLRIDEENQLSFKLVGNLSFLQDYQFILERECKIHHNAIIKDGNTYILKYCGNNLVPKICQFLYHNSTFYLDRKFDIYKTNKIL